MAKGVKNELVKPKIAEPKAPEPKVDFGKIGDKQVIKLEKRIVNGKEYTHAECEDGTIYLLSEAECKEFIKK